MSCKSLIIALFLTPATALASPLDAWITTKTKLQILNSSITDASINVDTDEGHVTLHGKVARTEDIDRAERVARDVKGVVDVKNLLQVVPVAYRDQVRSSDLSLTWEVKRLLQADPTLKDSRVVLESVNGGAVLLAGKATSMTDHLRAMQLVADLPGVVRVSSKIRGPDELAKGEVWPDEMATSGDIRDTSRDLRITAITKMRLLATAKVPALSVNVDTRNGVVTLFGEVPSTGARDLAIAEARKVGGVTHVVDGLQIVAKAQEEAVAEKDGAITSRARAALAERDTFSRVDVEVKSGAARLTGTVPTVWDRLAAARTVRAVKGVRLVLDGLAVKHDSGS